MTIIVKISLLLLFFLALSGGAQILVTSFRNLTRLTGWGGLALSELLIGLGTSLPELFIGINCGLKGQSSISLGNVLGSNIANLSLVIGISVLLAGKIKVVGSLLRSGLAAVFLIATTPLLFLSDERISRIEGLALVLIFFVWQKTNFSQNRPSILIKKRETEKKNEKTALFYFFRCLAGLAIILIAAKFTVQLSLGLARQYGVSEFILGVFILSIGSTLPELLVNINALRRKSAVMALGNLTGSIVTNSSLVLGISALISPIRLGASRQFWVTELFFLFIFGLFFIFVKSKKTLEKWEAAILVVSYLWLISFQLII